MSSDRKISYKALPTAITDKAASQQARRAKALEDQKRKRALRVDAARQLDSFANLKLGSSDDEAENDEDSPRELAPKAQGIAQFALMLETSTSNNISPIHPPPIMAISESTKRPSKNKRKSRSKKNKPSKWADKCMYAELLEMNDDDSWQGSGLPDNLETSFVAVAPVPVGKRCLAVTHQSAGLGGTVPNTTLRSRVLGKSLIARFPSWLPPLTILDCILDPNWRKNGILHVLDVLQWKGQDVGDCETAFRFWWRDTRLAELPHSPPPTASSAFIPKLPTSPSDADTSRQPPADGSSHYRFPYPTTFLAVPYHTNTTLPSLVSHIIPLARSLRSIAVEIPAISSTDAEMEVDAADGSVPRAAPLQSVSVNVDPDGLLLYVAQAGYEPGTSPLSSWIPILSYDQPREELLNRNSSTSAVEGPLDIFERLISQQIALGMNVSYEDNGMEK